ncbi:MAG: glycosyltransferase family 4 protein [Hydrogenobacter sp.]
MKIVWLNGNPNPNFGGTEIHTVQMIKELVKEGVQVLLVCAKNSYVDRHVHDVKKYYASFPNSLALTNTIRLARIIKKEKPDFLIANNGKEYVNALLAGKFANTKVVFFRHMERMKQWMVRRFVFPYVDMFLAVSQKVKENLVQEGVPEEKVRVVYNIVDEERFFYTEKQKDTVEILFVGKLDQGKGVMDFLEALEELTKTEINLKAWIVGDGSLRKAIDLYIVQKGLEKRIRAVGYTPKVEEYYKRAHICVIPSRETEAFPRVAIEALACGCALVVSDVGGIKEAVEEGYNGFVFRAGDTKDLIDKLKRAVKEWEKLSKNSRDLYERKFSRNAIMKSFFSALEELTR